MQVIEFNSQIERGKIAVPKTSNLADGLPVRVLVLLDETAEEKGTGQADAKSVWERTAGAWQGSQLVRESQGGCEAVQMKAPISHLKDPDMQKVPQALLRAAEKARQLAEQTGTPFVSRKSATEARKNK